MKMHRWKSSFAALFGYWMLLAYPISAADLVVGINIHPWNTSVQNNRRLLQDLGVQSYRIDVDWQSVEREPGVYDFSSAKVAHAESLIDSLTPERIDALVILLYNNKLYGNLASSIEAQQAYGNYAGAMAAHFRGRVKYWEIWNEWSGGTFGNCKNWKELPCRDARIAYNNFMCLAYAAIKAADPSAIVIGGVTPYIDVAFIRTLDFKCMDGLSVHPYVASNPTHYGMSRKATWAEKAQVFAQRMNALNDEVKELAGREIPIYITEDGFQSKHGREGQVKMINAILPELAKLPFVKGYWLYGLVDYGKYTYGISGKPAFEAYKAFARGAGAERAKR